MLPQNAISEPAYSAAFLEPDSNPYLALTDYEKGGVGISNASQGRLVRNWTCFVDGVDVYVAPAEDLATRTLILSGSDITTVSVAFDTNMNVALAYMRAGVLNLYWYDTLVGHYVTTSYPDCTSGRVGTDEKRPSLEAISDVIFAYVLGDVLYWRQQRDRYTVEYTAGPAGGAQLTRIGMSVLNRFQFELAS